MEAAKNVGRDEYPTTVQGAYELLLNTALMNQQYNRNKDSFKKDFGKGDKGPSVSFAQESGSNGDTTFTAGTDGVIHKTITCFKCGKLGHFADKCDGETKSGMMGVQHGIIFNHGNKNVIIQKDWVLLDSCSTDSC